MQYEEKLKTFEKLIMDKAAAKRDDILEQMQKRSKIELEESKEQALEAAYNIMQMEVSDISLEASGDFSKKSIELKKALFLKRAEYENELFGGAKQKLIAYTATPAYAEKLAVDLKAVIKKYGFTTPILRLREADSQYGTKLLALFPKKNPCTLEISDLFEIGGFILEDPIQRRIVDMTLDHSLDEQREWFHTNSGFNITEQL